MRRSLESSRPILKNKSNDSSARTSHRISTYSSLAPSVDYTEKSNMSAPSGKNDSRVTEVTNYTQAIDRMQDKRLQSQRYTKSLEKDETMDKLALAAKLQRAIDRRFSSQDAVFSPKAAKRMSEKPAVKA